jgi:hypothetical protein
MARVVIVIVNVMMIVMLLWEVLVRVCAIRFVMVLVRGFVSEPSEPVDLVAHRTSCRPHRVSWDSSRFKNHLELAATSRRPLRVGRYSEAPE